MLQRPIDRIVRNDAGAHATREMLALSLGRGRDRLKGKRVVIWEFAARELSMGDWKLIDLRLNRELGDAGLTQSLTGTSARVTGTVASLSERPRNDATYKDFVMKLYITDMVGENGAVYADGDGVVHVMAMRNRKILPVAALRTGARVTMSVRRWEEVASRYESLKTGALNDIMLEIDKALYWAEVD